MEYIIFGAVAIFGYQVYRSCNPTIKDLIEKKETMTRHCEYNKNLGKEIDKINDWEERCLSAGMILPY